MDILIELEDGSLANLAAQKVGYMFPGQRVDCYTADLLLRQYKRVRGEKGEAFNFPVNPANRIKIQHRFSNEPYTT